MTDKRSLLNGMALGAGLMYLLDPARGTRRRAGLRDQVVHLAHQVDDGMGTALRDLGNRTRGVVSETRSRLQPEGEVPERVLEARVRSELGRVVSHPGAIEVRAEGDRVVLSGDVLEDELNRLLSVVLSVRGVEQVTNQLRVHASAGDVPALQGNTRRPEPRFELMQENWSPAARLLMSGLGGALTVRGLRASNPLDVVVGLFGAGVLARALTNLEMKRLLGVDAGRRAVELQKTINIDAPVEEVFGFWKNYENFPRFMSHLREVRMTGEGRSHWSAEGPGGVPLSWDAETTVYVENERIGWKSVGGSPVHNAGIVRFEQNPAGGTRITVHLSYNPPAGGVGHAVARLLGSDPKQAMDDDMVRLKSLIEDGRATAHGNTVDKEDVG